MPIDAVIFDWGGTLTAWHDIDFHAESLALAQAVVDADHDVEVSQQRLHEAGSVIWGRSRDHQQSSTVADLFTEAGLEHDPDLLSAYYDFWEPHTYTDPEVRPTWEALRADGVKVGRAVEHDLAARVPRGDLRARRGARPGRRRRLHERDPVDQAVAARVPGRRWRRSASPTRRGASTSATGSSTTSGAPSNAGMRAIHVPHSDDPGRAGRPHRGDAGRGRPAPRRDPGVVRVLGVVARRSCAAGLGSRRLFRFP